MRVSACYAHFHPGEVSMYGKCYTLPRRSNHYWHFGFENSSSPKFRSSDLRFVFTPGQKILNVLTRKSNSPTDSKTANSSFRQGPIQSDEADTNRLCRFSPIQRRFENFRIH